MRNLLDELTKRGIEYRQSASREDQLYLCCPYCVERGETPDFRFRLGIDLTTGVGHCFNCEYASGGALREYLRLISFDEEYEVKKPEPKPKIKLELPHGFELLADCDVDDPVFGAAKKYCIERGISERQLREKEVGATITDDEFRYRIVFPIRSKDGELRGLVGRDWTGTSERRYWNKVGAERSVWNARPDIYPKRLAIVAEGIMKALAIERATHYGVCVMALNGKSATDKQAMEMRGFQELVMFSDPDRDGIRGFLRVAQSLSLIHRITFAFPIPTKQADDLKPEIIRSLLRGRKSYSPALEIKIRRGI